MYSIVNASKVYFSVLTCKRIFGYKAEEAENVIYVNWLSLLWNACAKALELYQPATKSWLQVREITPLNIIPAYLDFNWKRGLMYQP